MAELLSPERVSDGRAFEREWTTLREYVSRWSDKEQLQQSSCSYGQSRGLLVHGHLQPIDEQMVSGSLNRQDVDVNCSTAGAEDSSLRRRATAMILTSQRAAIR